VYDSLEWHRRAACLGEDRLFLSDRTLGKAKNLGSATLTLALAICSTCPVRRECLAEGLRDIRIDLDPRSDAQTHPSATVPADGVWGGTTTADRTGVRHLPRAEAAAVLEGSFPARLARHVEAFRRRVRATPDQRRSRRVRRLLAMLAAGRVAVTGRCAVCGVRLPALARSDARYCSVRCRVAAYRARAAGARNRTAEGAGPKTGPFVCQCVVQP
jgi:hypothetical protein